MMGEGMLPERQAIRGIKMHRRGCSDDGWKGCVFSTRAMETVTMSPAGILRR